MQTCEVCNFTGNPADAKYCIECASTLPVKVYSGITSRLHTNIGKDHYPFRLLVSGAINDDYGYKVEYGTISSGAYSPFLQPFKYIPPIGQLEDDILYVTRDEYYQLVRDTHFFQAFSYVDRDETIAYFHGYIVK